MTPPYLQLTYAYHEGKPYLAVATVPLKPAEPAVMLKFKPAKGEGELFDSAEHAWGNKLVSETDGQEALAHTLRLTHFIKRS